MARLFRIELIMKNLKYLLIVMVFVGISCDSNKGRKYNIEYTITPNIKDSLSINVVFKYKTNANGELKLNYLNNSMGDNDIFNCIKNLKVHLGDANITFIKDSNLIKIKSKPYKELEVSYTIKQDFNGPLFNQHRYRPIISKTYFHILGVRLFMVPENLFASEVSKARIGVHWKGIGDNDIFHSSFGYERNQTLNVTEENLHASFFIGGDFRRKEFLYKDKPVYFVTRGKWNSFTDEDIFNLLKETISFQNDFWKDSIQTRFSVSLLPTEETNRYSIGGSGFSNSFISFASNNQFTGLKNMAWLYNHELLHKWLARTIKNENEVEQYWFSEGFTDYYAHKLLLKNNKITLNDFINTLNTTISEHHKDKINTISNSELTFENYWGNYSAYQKLPYRRGLLYAFLIDSQIKIKTDFTKSLDQLILDLLRLAREDNTFRINEKEFKNMLLKYLDEKALVDFDNYILHGKLIDFPSQLFDGLLIEYLKDIPNIKIDTTKNIKLLDNQIKL